MAPRGRPDRSTRQGGTAPPSGPAASGRKGAASAARGPSRVPGARVAGPRPAPRAPSSGDRASSNRTPGARSPGERTHEREFVPICGLPAVQALFARDPGRVERLFFEPSLVDALAGPRRLLAQRRKPYREVASDELARIAGTVRHGGVVAVARPRPLLPFDPKIAAFWARENRPLLILDGVGNPHNLGAILRSAAYFGMARALLAERPEQALPSASSYRIAEGALEHLLLYRAPLPAAIGALRRGGFRVIGTALGRATPLADFRGADSCRDRPVALVLGNEERGVDPTTLALCDTVVTIPGITIPGVATPGAGGVQSLNVAAAAAILLYVLTSR
jgi:TrmH RNA methyltransferase